MVDKVQTACWHAAHYTWDVGPDRTAVRSKIFLLQASFPSFYFQDNGSLAITPSGMSSMTEATTSSNEDLLLEKSETHTKNENNISPPKKSEDRSSGIPRPPRDKSARRQLVLDISSVNNKTKSAVPGLLSPTLSPDTTKRRTQSRWAAQYNWFKFFIVSLIRMFNGINNTHCFKALLILHKTCYFFTVLLGIGSSCYFSFSYKVFKEIVFDSGE